jgi:FkbM family methyltransferase
MPLCQIEGHTFFSQGLSPESVVLDLGANLGRFSRGIIDRFGCRCYAVEANPSLCQQITSDSRMTVLNLAVAARSGSAPLHVSRNSECSSILDEPPPDATGTVHVKAVSLTELLTVIGIGHVDLIKFDIEGAEIHVFDSCQDAFLKRFPQITIEFHDFLGLTPLRTVERVVSRLRGLDFIAIKMWRTAYGDTVFVNRNLAPVGLLDCLWARYVIRNWWGAKRVLAARGVRRRP